MLLGKAFADIGHGALKEVFGLEGNGGTAARQLPREACVEMQGRTERVGSLDGAAAIVGCGGEIEAMRTVDDTQAGRGEGSTAPGMAVVSMTVPLGSYVALVPAVGGEVQRETPPHERRMGNEVEALGMVDILLLLFSQIAALPRVGERGVVAQGRLQVGITLTERVQTYVGQVVLAAPIAGIAALTVVGCREGMWGRGRQVAEKQGSSEDKC